MKYIPLFILIQLVSLVLQLVGLPVCAYLALCGNWRTQNNQPLHFPKWAWIWDNQEDGVCPYTYMRENLPWSISRVCFYWTALRNPVNNLRYVPGVSKVGRPLFYNTWTVLGKQFYVKAGWMSNGFPACSFGAGRGY